MTFKLAELSTGNVTMYFLAFTSGITCKRSCDLNTLINCQLMTLVQFDFQDWDSMHMYSNYRVPRLKVWYGN